jgi:hypothetical protein
MYTHGRVLVVILILSLKLYSLLVRHFHLISFITSRNVDYNMLVGAVDSVLDSGYNPPVHACHSYHYCARCCPILEVLLTV